MRRGSGARGSGLAALREKGIEKHNHHKQQHAAIAHCVVLLLGEHFHGKAQQEGDLIFNGEFHENHAAGAQRVQSKGKRLMEQPFAGTGKADDQKSRHDDNAQQLHGAHKAAEAAHEVIAPEALKPDLHAGVKEKREVDSMYSNLS